MKTVFITITRGSLIRNFFHSGVVGLLLDSGLKVVVLSPFQYSDDLYPGFKHENLKFEPLKRSKNIKFRKIFGELFKGAVFNRTVDIRFKYRFSGEKPNLFFYPFRIVFFAPLRFIPFSKKVLRYFEDWVNPQTENDNLFKKYKPDLVFLTSSSHTTDIAVLKSAKRRGVKSVLMPKSWDNLSKILFPCKADYLFVWNSFMKEQALLYQDYKKDEVFISGIPQFDIYYKKEILLGREEFCKIFQLDFEKKIILYSSTGGECCDEPVYVDLINEWIEEEKLKNVQVLIRPHLGYIGDIERFNKFQSIKNCSLDNTAKQNDSFKDHWDVSDKYDSILYNSLIHSAVNINLASTLTLDAAACKIQVININFDVNSKVDPQYSVKRLYQSDYIKAIAKTKGAWLVKNETELYDALKRTVNFGEKKDSSKLVDRFIYKNDGKASERIRNRIVDILTKV